MLLRVINPWDHEFEASLGRTMEESTEKLYGILQFHNSKETLLKEIAEYRWYYKNSFFLHDVEISSENHNCSKY